MTVRKLAYVGCDSWGRHVYQDEHGKYWKHIDCTVSREICQERGDSLYSSDGFEGEPGWPMKPEIQADFI